MAQLDYDSGMDLRTVMKGLRKVENVSRFARKSGVSRRTLHRLLAGWDNPTQITLQKITNQLRRDGL